MNMTQTAHHRRMVGVLPATRFGLAATRLPRVLLAMYAEGEPSGALQRAYELAQAMGGELFVLSVLPEGTTLRSRLLATRWSASMRSAARLLCDEVLPTRLSDEKLLVCQGSFLATVAHTALALGVDLLILPPREGQSGPQVTRLAQSTKLPVLVARRPGSTDTIIAASDLQDRGYPVLHRAKRLGCRLLAPVVCVHNLPPLLRLIEVSPGEDEKMVAERHLQRVSATLALHADTEVMTSLSTSEAILSVARQRRADLIVVGVHQESGRAGVAAEVVEKAARSVLVHPIQ